MPEVAPRPERPPPLAAATVASLQERVLGWYAANRRDLPWRRTNDPYAILVSEMMLQQTQASRVAPRFAAWLKAFPTLESLAQAPLGDALLLWSGLGYNNRARRLRDCALAAVASARVTVGAGGQAPPATLPRTVDELRRLPGIGSYTARAVLIFAHNDDLAAVDANVRRVLVHELQLRETLPERALQEVAEAVLPHGRSREWHNALMDYGALVLTGRSTGIAARTRQSAFDGSRRQHRARVVRLLLAGGPLPVHEIAQALDLPPQTVGELVDVLAHDGLLRRDGDLAAIA